MGYKNQLAERVRTRLSKDGKLKIEEKKMFKGLTFMVNSKMCISVSNENLMCRFDPSLNEVVSLKKGFQPMIMKGKRLEGYCYVEPVGLESEKDFTYWIDLCLEFNAKAKSSKK